MSETRSLEEEIFEKAQQLHGEERAAYLEQAVHGDQELRKRVERLLQAQENIGEFLNHPIAAVSRETLLLTTSKFAGVEKPSDKIGRYKLLQLIGVGGFGDVWMAEQEEPIRRRVALKVIKLGMDSKEVVARFEAERQALAMMDHPSVAKVFDGGLAESGRPYFVMELVHGESITKYCNEHRLSTSERLELFTQVCQAVQHAHQKGIIHRDLKPSNILVTELDGKAVPKVIDFGVAKATEARLTEKTVFTRLGQMVGTPEYMSPEQASQGGLDIDTRTDVYSLGVVLYELLTGRTPFDAKKLREAAYDVIVKTIREDEPPKPSTKLSTLSPEELNATAHQRRVEPAKLNRLVRGDLDWIVLKALEKERARRYETASAFAQDIQHHLRFEPVIAAAPKPLYKFRKFARRNKVALAIATAFGALLVIGTIFSTWQAVRATRADSKSRQVAQFLKEMLNGVRPSIALGRDKTMLREILDKTAERVGKELKNQPEVEAELRSTIGAVYWEIGDYAKAERMHREALEIRKKLFGFEHPDTAASLNNLGLALFDEAKLTEAEAVLRQAVAVRKRVLGKDHPDVAWSLRNLALVRWKQGNLADAESLHRQSLEIKKRRFGEENSDVAASLNDLANILMEQGKLAEAEAAHREALGISKTLLGDEHPHVAVSLNNLAIVLDDEGKFAEAEAAYRAVLAISRKVLGNDHPDIANTLNGLALVLRSQGKFAEAESTHREALALQRKVLGHEHPDVAASLNNLGLALRDEGKLSEAETLLGESLAMKKKFLGDEHPSVASSLNSLGSVLELRDQLPEAESKYREALAMRKKLLGNENPRVAQSLADLAAILHKEGKPMEVEGLARESLLIFERKAPTDWETFSVRCLMGRELLRQGRYSEAEPLLLSGYQGMAARQNAIPAFAISRLRKAMEDLVQLYESMAQFGRVDEWKKKLVEFDQANAEKNLTVSPH